MITTPRLLLRRWQPSDRAHFAALNADPEVMRFFPSTRDARSSDDMVDRIDARIAARGFGLWALERRDTGEFIGFTGLNPMPDGVPGEGGEEVGWRLARAHWRQGFASEAAEAALEYAFTTAQLDLVNSITAVLNEPSQAVMRRIGMSHVDDFEHPVLAEGHALRPHVRYVITREEWRQRHERGSV